MREPQFAPEWATRSLEKLGRNPYGETIFRVIWAPSRFRIMGGLWEDTGTHEYRAMPQYGNNPRWIMERWLPASTFGNPYTWEEQTRTPDGFLGIGPFPHRGRFEHLSTFGISDAKDRPVKGWAGYVPLEPGLVEMMARFTWMGRNLTYWQIRREMEDAALAKEAVHDRNFDEMWDERQLTRPGLTLGAAGAFNKQQEIDDYARRLERSGAFVDARKSRKGFRQLPT